jgi:hypothetical protein
MSSLGLTNLPWYRDARSVPESATRRVAGPDNGTVHGDETVLYGVRESSSDEDRLRAPPARVRQTGRSRSPDDGAACGAGRGLLTFRLRDGQCRSETHHAEARKDNFDLVRRVARSSSHECRLTDQHQCDARSKAGPGIGRPGTGNYPRL